jgi:hypothetical protein
MTSEVVTAAAAGTWKLGDLTVNRMGFGAMRLPQTGRALVAEAVPGDRGKAITVLLEANVAAAALRLTGAEQAMLEAVTITA